MRRVRKRTAPRTSRDDAGGFSRFELVEAAGILAILVAKGKMVQQVFRGPDVLLRQQFGKARADAAHIHHWSIETGHILDANAPDDDRFQLSEMALRALRTSAASTLNTFSDRDGSESIKAEKSSRQTKPSSVPLAALAVSE